ncbi:hypothetical protein BCF44_11822 [Kutzneria buriramensis]|uniref:Uncharacterized protein n=1 Tax=Kutzneria buriramensis TaxID=1045776 RepID=A0A3E0GYZ0_9PSEU|nr:hypothetical protein BCF44_11822 [Kutzneria buriramensis]
MTANPYPGRLRKLTLREQAIMELDRVVAWLETGAVDDTRVFGTTDERDWMLRMCAALLALLDEHEVDEFGRCTRCREPRSGLRKALPGSRRAPTCAVLDAVLAAFGDTVEAVWSRVLATLGSDMTEDEVRDWLATPPPAPEPAMSLFNVDVIGGYGFGAAEFNLEQVKSLPEAPDETTDPISGWFRRPYILDDEPTEPGTALRVVNHYRQQAKVWRTPEELAGESETVVLPRLEVADTIPMYLPSFGPVVRA